MTVGGRSVSTLLVGKCHRGHALRPPPDSVHLGSVFKHSCQVADVSLSKGDKRSLAWGHTTPLFSRHPLLSLLFSFHSTLTETVVTLVVTVPYRPPMQCRHRHGTKRALGIVGTVRTKEQVQMILGQDSQGQGQAGGWRAGLQGYKTGHVRVAVVLHTSNFYHLVSIP